MAMSQLQAWKDDQDLDTNKQQIAGAAGDAKQTSLDTPDSDSWASSFIDKMQKIAQNGFARTNRIEPLHNATNGSAKPTTNHHTTKPTKSRPESASDVIKLTSDDATTSLENLK